jgi:hypothetical protein
MNTATEYDKWIRDMEGKVAAALDRYENASGVTLNEGERAHVYDVLAVGLRQSSTHYREITEGERFRSERAADAVKSALESAWKEAKERSDTKESALTEKAAHRSTDEVAELLVPYGYSFRGYADTDLSAHNIAKGEEIWMDDRGRAFPRNAAVAWCTGIGLDGDEPPPLRCVK